jgi:hypothetical protein
MHEKGSFCNFLLRERQSEDKEKQNRIEEDEE